MRIVMIILATMLVMILCSCSLAGFRMSVAGFGVDFELTIDGADSEVPDDKDFVGPSLGIVLLTPVPRGENLASFSE